MSKTNCIAAYEKGYRICKQGYVTGLRGRPLSLNALVNGYREFNFNLRGRYYHVCFHQFQAYCKYGDRYLESGIVARHKNGKKLDNSWGNILIGTYSQNMLDRPKAERVAHAKLAAKSLRRPDWPLIEADWSKGWGFTRLSKKYKMSKGTLSYHFKNMVRPKT